MKPTAQRDNEKSGNSDSKPESETRMQILGKQNLDHEAHVLSRKHNTLELGKWNKTTSLSIKTVTVNCGLKFKNQSTYQNNKHISNFTSLT